MRIIAGRHRGRRLLAPEGLTTRPITDRVKQSLFDRLASADRLEGAIVLDAFAGTGSLGVECLSRGAAHATFIELDRSAAALLEKNLATLGESGAARVLRASALSGALLGALPRRDYTLVFVDPPYPMAGDGRQAARLWAAMTGWAGVCAPGAWLVLRVERHAHVEPLEAWGAGEAFEYGSMTLHVFRRGE